MTRRSLWYSLALFALGLVAVAGTLYATRDAEAAIFTVNSTADTDDAACNTSPNCTLREAIDAANTAGGPDVITFDPAVFDPFAPATISLASELPDIEPEVSIDGTGSGVIIEPSAGTTIQWGFFVRDDAAADTDFELVNVTVRGMQNDPGDDTIPGTPNAPDGDAVYVCGDDGAACGADPVDGVTITDVTAYAISGDALDIDGDGTDNVNVDGADFYALGGDGVNVCCGTDVSVTGSSISALSDGIVVTGGGADGATVDITGNESIIGGEYGIQLLLCDASATGCPGTTNDVLIDGNGGIIGSGEQAIEVLACHEQLCDGATNAVAITNNDLIQHPQFAEAILVQVCYGVDADCDGSTNTVNVDDNGKIVGHYRAMQVDVCTSLENGGCDDTVNTATVDRNETLHSSQDDTIDIDVCEGFSPSVGCGTGGGPQAISVSDNTLIEGADSDESINLDLCNGDGTCEATTATVTVDGNDRIDGSYNTIEVDLCQDCDGTAVTLAVTNNGPITSGEDDIIDAEVCARSCNSIASPQTPASVLMDISHNDTITGADSDQALNLDVCRGEFGCSGLDGGGTPVIMPITVTIEDNDTIWAGDDVLELDQCTYGSCDYADVSLSVSGHPGGLDSIEDDTFYVRQCVGTDGSCSFGDVTIDIYDNGFMSAGDDAEVFDVDQCQARLCDTGTHRVSITNNGMLDGVNEIVEAEQCSGSDGGCPDSTNTFTISGHPELRGGDSDTINFSQCELFGTNQGCDNSTNTITIDDNGDLFGGDGAIELDQCVLTDDSLGCADGANSITITNNGDMTSENPALELDQCDLSSSALGCDGSINTITIDNNGDMTTSDNVMDIDQCLFSGDALGCNGGTNIISVTNNGDSTADDHSFDFDQCVGSTATNAGGGCDGSTNTIRFDDNGDHYNSDDGIFEFSQCESFVNFIDGKSCHGSTNTIGVDGNGDLIATDGDEVLNADQCRDIGCDNSDNFIELTNNGYMNADEEMLDADQCQVGSEFAVGCDDSTISIVVTGNEDMLSESYEVVKVDQCNGNYDGSCNNSTITILVDENGYLWGGNSSDDAFEINQCTSSICDNSTVAFTATDHHGITGHDGILNIDVCSFTRSLPVTFDTLPGSCLGTDIDVVLQRNGELRSLSGDGLEADICYDAICGIYSNGGPIATTVDVSMSDHLGIGPANGDDVVDISLCRGDYGGCIGDPVTRIPVNITIEDNGPLRGGNAGLRASICDEGSARCIDADIDITVNDHPSISAGTNRVFEVDVCDDLADNTPIGIGACSETTVDLNFTDNGNMISGPDQAGVGLSVCHALGSVDFCDDLDVTLNYSDNGILTAGRSGIFVEGGESTALTSPYTVDLNIVSNDAIIGLDGHGLNFLGYFEDGLIDDNGIIGLGTHTDDDSSGPVQFVAHDGINFGEVHGEEEAEPQAQIYDLDITNNAIASSHGRGITLSDEGEDNLVSGNTISRNGGAGVAIVGGADGLTDTTVTDNDITDNGGTGVLVVDSSDNTIGPDNVITGNGIGGTGIDIVGDDSDGNTITQNEMSNNIGLGIDLGNDGITTNDGGDADAGPNQELNYPENMALNGSNLEGDACAGCTVEVFLTEAPQDNSGHGEGETYLGSATANGSGDFTFALGTPCSGSGFVTTTATDAAGNTSEFSLNLNISSLCGTPTATPTASPSPTPTAPPATPCTTPRPTRTPIGMTPGPSPVNPCGSSTPAPSPTATGTPTATPTASPTPSPTPSGQTTAPTPRPTRTPNP